MDSLAYKCVGSSTIHFDPSTFRKLVKLYIAVEVVGLSPNLLGSGSSVCLGPQQNFAKMQRAKCNTTVA